MRTSHIRALTGIRFFAALWVVLYHSTRYNLDLLTVHHPDLIELVGPVLMQGFRGVDLFFLLSGFVLALNYLDEIGPRFDLGRAARYLWLRLARIWPLYVLVLVASGLLILARASLWDSAPRGRVTWLGFLEQLFMVQLWTSPRTAGTSWSGPAWSISAEWLAYLLFPVFALAVLRLQHRLRARWLLVAAVAVLVPLLLTALGPGLHSPWAWVPRILCEFVAGMLLCAAVSRWRVSERQRAVAGVLAIVTTAGIVVFYYLADSLSTENLGAYSIPAMLLLIGCLAVGTGPLSTLLATRTLVVGGHLSYGLYLWHSPLLYAFRDLTTYSRVDLEPLPRYYAELAWIPVIVLVAWATYHAVEEPARRFLRDRWDNRLPPAERPREEVEPEPLAP